MLVNSHLFINIYFSILRYFFIEFTFIKKELIIKNSLDLIKIILKAVSVIYVTYLIIF